MPQIGRQFNAIRDEPIECFMVDANGMPYAALQLNAPRWVLLNAPLWAPLNAPRWASVECQTLGAS